MKSITALFLLFCFLVPSALVQLKFAFYGPSCHRTGSIISSVVAERFRRDPSITAALLRMQFHDCFVTVRKLLLVCVNMYYNGLTNISRRN